MKRLFAEELHTFPPPEMALEDGLVDCSDDLSVERLLEAYSFGIFPWPQGDYPTLWFCPPERGVLDFKELHIPTRLRRSLRDTGWTVSINEAFAEVIKACAAAPRKDQPGTWITPKLHHAYLDFHHAGYAHSVEIWQEDELVGGIYGVFVGGVFSGESMFHHRDNASKFAFLQLIEWLLRNDVKWLDIQMVTPLLKAFGGKYIPRAEFLRRLDRAKETARWLNI